MVCIQVNGKPAPEFEDARIGFTYTDRIYKRDEAALILADPDRKFRDKMLKPDDAYKVSWGYPGNMSSPRSMRLKSWTTEMDENMGAVRLRLQVTGRDGAKKSNKVITSEMHKSYRPKNWGRVPTSQIAINIAKRHRLGVLVDDSGDSDRTDQVQPANVSDYGYLRRLAENIDFEFFIERNVIYYRKKPYDEPPRRTFTYLPSDEDSLLLRFHPDVKVVSASTKPNSVDVEQGEKPWSAYQEAAVGLAAEVFVDKQKEIEEAVDILVNETDEQFQSANALRLAFDDKPSEQSAVERNDSYQQITELLIAAAESKKASRENQKTVDKQTRKNKTKKYGQDDKGPRNCPKGQQFPGSVPTGESKESLEFGVRGDRPDRFVQTDLKARLGIVDSTVQTTDSTTEVRKKRACASHAKRTDKAVTAKAEFIGDPSLRAKVNFRFRNIGRLFEGNWYSKQADHDVGESIYTVSLSLKRGTLSGKGNKNNTGNNSGSNSKKNDVKQEQVLRLGIRPGTEDRFVNKPKVANK